MAPTTRLLAATGSWVAVDADGTPLIWGDTLDEVAAHIDALPTFDRIIAPR